MEKVKDQKDDVKSENEVFEAKPSSSFSGFGFNQLSDPLVFSNYGAAFGPANTEFRFRHPLLLFRSPVLLCTSP